MEGILDKVFSNSCVNAHFFFFFFSFWLYSPRWTLPSSL